MWSAQDRILKQAIMSFTSSVTCPSVYFGGLRANVIQLWNAPFLVSTLDSSSVITILSFIPSPLLQWRKGGQEYAHVKQTNPCDSNDVSFRWCLMPSAIKMYMYH